VAARSRSGTSRGATRSGAKGSSKGPAKGAADAKASGRTRGPDGSRPAAESAGPGLLGRMARSIGGFLLEQRRDVGGVILLLAAVISGLAVYLEAAGPVGEGIRWLTLGTLGVVGYLLPVGLVGLGLLLVSGRSGPDVGRAAFGSALAAGALLGGIHLAVDVPAPGDGIDRMAEGGGFIGWLVAAPLDAALSRAGAWAVVVAVLILGLLLATRKELRSVAGAFAALLGPDGFIRGALRDRDVTAETDSEAAGGDTTAGGTDAQRALEDRTLEPVLIDIPIEEDLTVLGSGPSDADTYGELMAVDVHAAQTQPIDTAAINAALVATGSAGADVDAAGVDPLAETSATPRKARKVLPPSDDAVYELPPLDLLAGGRADAGDLATTIGAQTRALQETFDQFGIDAKVARSSRGPTVTRFEVEIGPGVKVNKVANLGDDIAYALAAPDVRIVAPIPGKSAIGIEVPNIKRDLITLGDVLRSDVARRDEHPLSVALGVDIAGAPVMIDLATMPHLLVSGSTGSGKSVTLNGMIASILMRARPDQVRMLLIDPKRVELGVYEGAPHLLAPVVTDPRRATDAVQWCVKEMEQRYELLALLGFRNIDGYNDAYDRGALESRPGPDGTTIPPRRLPYVLLVIDELADLMLVAPRDVEDAICRIAQMARAVGIHMVIATQRPSVDVITGLIKANIPSRLALAVASQTDSRTILDAGGAEKLVGRGDMLFLPASQGKPSRLQGCWVTEEEIAAVVGFCRTQREPVFEEAVLKRSEGTRSGGSGSGRMDDEGDAGLLRRAAEQVVSSGLGSTSMLQRKLRVGFARAGRLMDELEQVGCVGPSEGSKAREVLWDQAQLDAALESGLI